MPCTLKHFLGYSRCQIYYMLHWLNEGESIKRQKGLSQLQKLTKMQEIKKKNQNGSSAFTTASTLPYF